MSKILLRAGKSPFQVLSARASVDDYPSAVFATNVGNMVYSDAMHRILSTPDAEVVANTYLGERGGVNRAYTDRINSEFDHFVVPLANAFRPSFLRVLDRLTETIEALRIPVTVVGVGVEGGPGSLSRAPEDVDQDIKSATRRFMNAVLDRSSRVGVRGESTRSYLRSLGYGDEHVQIIGCPSLFRNGAALHVDKLAHPLQRDDLISINISPDVKPMAEFAMRQAAQYPRLVYIPQDLETFQLLLTGRDPKEFDPVMPTHRGHPFFKEGRVITFVDSRTWIDFLKSVRFAFGTRIHGNIAALLAGTPAVVMVHDTRTRELVDYHEIPNRLSADAAKLDAAGLYEEADFTAFNEGHQGRFETFSSFLRENGISTVFDQGKANPAYDRAIAALPLPRQVRLLDEPASTGPLYRLRRRWRQTNYRFSAPVPHAPASLGEAAGAAIDRIITRRTGAERAASAKVATGRL